MKEFDDSRDLNLNIFTVAPNVWGLKDTFVNFFMIRNSGSENWVLIDAGLKSSAPKIRQMAAQLFGTTSRPQAIVLTHGHFDHVGSLARLAEEWNVPVYAHSLEIPYLTGKSAYPPPDPSVGGGLMAFLSFLYPKGPINISERINILPAGGIVPGLPEWRIIHTPGHTPGHISLYREKDRVIIAGDALVTVRAESAMAIMRQKKKLHGPPKYFTSDWPSAGDSVNKIAALEPDIIATGHGQPMRGADMRNELNKLSWQFDRVAIPRQGRYVNYPALADEAGVQYLPPGQEQLPSLVKIALVTATITLALVIFMRNRRPKPKSREISVDIFRPKRAFELN